METVILKLQADVEARKHPRLELTPALRNALGAVLLAACAFLLGARSAQSASVPWESPARAAVNPAGALDLQQTEIERLKRIHENSARFGIPADLAERIEDIARAEGIEPEVAFGLVRAESEFNRRAVSPVGAVGLTQLMPSTARYFQAGVSREQLFDRDTNLRIGFRYLATLLKQYDGDLELALLAYNRGPERVNQLLRSGRTPHNGYVEMVLGRRAARR
jgi:soluble lytic murein transglycosylase-like protein